MTRSGANVRDRLLAAARRHRPADRKERAHQQAIEAWLLSTDKPLDSGEYDPGHAVGSAFVVSTEGDVALVYHSTLGRWLQPGGHADRGESDLAAVAAREAREELGIDLSADDLTLFDLDVHTIPDRGDEPAHVHFDFRFLCAVTRVPLRAGSDARRASWFTPSEARAVATDEGLERMIGKAAAAIGARPE